MDIAQLLRGVATDGPSAWDRLERVSDRVHVLCCMYSATNGAVDRHVPSHRCCRFVCGTPVSAIEDPDLLYRIVCKTTAIYNMQRVQGTATPADDDAYAELLDDIETHLNTYEDTPWRVHAHVVFARALSGHGSTVRHLVEGTRRCVHILKDPDHPDHTHVDADLGRAVCTFVGADSGPSTDDLESLRKTVCQLPATRAVCTSVCTVCTEMCTRLCDTNDHARAFDILMFTALYIPRASYGVLDTMRTLVRTHKWKNTVLWREIKQGIENALWDI